MPGKVPHSDKGLIFDSDLYVGKYNFPGDHLEQLGCNAFGGG